MNSVTATDVPTLSQAKELLDAGAIPQAEYEAIKARRWPSRTRHQRSKGTKRAPEVLGLTMRRQILDRSRQSLGGSMSDRDNYSGGAVGMTMFASVILMVIGVFQSLAGLAAIINDDRLLATEDYVIKLDTTSWGWIHLILGIVIFLAGLGLLQGQVWARTIAVILAALSAIANFVWLPIQPWWAIIIITLDIFVIWAVTVHGRDITKV